MPDTPLTGKVAVVTGGASGIGRASATALARAGAAVMIGDLADAFATVEDIQRLGGRAATVSCDIADEAQVEELFAAAVREFGRVDVLHANAGLGHGQAKLTEIELAAWQRTVSVNLTGNWLCLRAGIRQMLQQGNGGAVVVTSSATGLVGFPQVAGYAATKAALISLVKTAAIEFAEASIRVNAVAPGPIATDMVRRAMEENPALAEHLQASVPLRRVGEPINVADAVVWLCSDAAAYITGAVLPIDGGQVAG